MNSAMIPMATRVAMFLESDREFEINHEMVAVIAVVKKRISNWGSGMLKVGSGSLNGMIFFPTEVAAMFLICHVVVPHSTRWSLTAKFIFEEVIKRL